MRDRRYLAVIPIAAILAVLPLILKGNSCGHDFEFHIFNWLEVGSQWRQGWLDPQWEFTSAWNSGEPRFVFYPPLSWTLGAILGMALPWAAAPIAFIWIALTACGLSMYRAAHEWTSRSNALIAACFYMVHPYMLLTYYERSAYSELLAAAWLPLVVAAVLRSRVTLLSIAVPVALLWLTNDPAAVMGCYTLAVLCLLRCAFTYRQSRRIRIALKEAATIAAGTGLGLALTGFYLVPAAFEQKWVQIRLIMIEGVRVQDNFLFTHTGDIFHRATVRTASLCSVALLGMIGVFALSALASDLRRGRNSETKHRSGTVVSLALTAIVIGFLLTASSALVWQYAPELKYLQFPWRFNAVLGSIAAASLALALGRAKIDSSFAVCIALAASLLGGVGGYKLYRQWCNRGNDTASLVQDFYHGNVYDFTDSYAPVGADHFAIAHNNPNAWIASSPYAPAPPDVPPRYSVNLADRLHFDVSTPKAAFLVINLRDYPAWQITVNGIAAGVHPHRKDGLIAVPIASGESKIEIRYRLTWDRIAGWVITALALCVCLWIRLSKSQSSTISEQMPLGAEAPSSTL